MQHEKNLCHFKKSTPSRALKPKWQYPGVMAIVMYSLFITAVVELSIAYVFYEEPVEFYKLP